jgi:phosphate transport system ATP-binding protein
MSTKSKIAKQLKSKNKKQKNENKIVISDLSFYYGDKKIIENVSFPIKKNTITSIIGSSGCGKTTLLKTINRLHEENPLVKISGSILLDGEDINDKKVNVILLRKRTGMVFQKPNPFPGSIYDNVVFGPRLYGIRNREELDWVCEKSLKQAALWDEVKNRLRAKALTLSGGQQQRLCMARTLALEPEVILMDEPCSALDPVSTLRIEDLMVELKKKYTLVIVTHNMQQASRISDFVAFMYAGEDLIARLVEYGSANKIFVNPTNPLTEKYVAGG